MTGLQIVPAPALPAAMLHAAFTEAFSDYLIGPFTPTLEQWPFVVARQAIDMAASRIALRGGEVLAFAYAAPRPELGFWRLAAMGAPPAARGSGAAAALLDDFITRARQAGTQGVELECFAQNERAQRLYRGHGFEPVHELHGYKHEGLPAASAGDAPQVQVLPVPEAFARLRALNEELRDLPLQVTPASLSALPVVLQAWRHGEALLVFSQAANGAVTVNSLVDTEPGQGGAQALARALLARHPGQPVTVPQLQRPDLGGEALQRAGFARLPLHQLMMRRPLG